MVNPEKPIDTAKPVDPMPDTTHTANATKSPRRRVCVIPIEPRGLSRTVAALYIGISPSLFDEMVKDSRMPGPKELNSRLVWDRRELDEAFDALPNRNDRNPWDEEDAA